jgi:hypothetical protein
MKKMMPEEGELHREKKRQELKKILNDINLPEFKNPSSDFVKELLLDYLETCDIDAARIAKKEPAKGELFMFNFGRQMLLEKILKELGQEEVLSKLKSSRLELHVWKDKYTESKYKKIINTIKKLLK